jgi:gamma-glutamyltranspeptidase
LIDTAGGQVSEVSTDWNRAPPAAAADVANAVQGGKRPRSSMSPIIVVDHV